MQLSAPSCFLSLRELQGAKLQSPVSSLSLTEDSTKKEREVSEAVQWVEELASQPGDVSSTPRVKEENQLLRVVL